MGILARGGSGVKEIFLKITCEKFQHIYNADRNVLE